jgi:ribosomal protein S18 acetylase RimI-like enzyme
VREPTIRPMSAVDLPGMRASAQAAFHDLGERLRTPPPPPAPTSETGPAIVHQLLGRDPGGAWLATLDDEVCGAALAGLREGLWYLAHLHVGPGHQGRGIGRRLLDAALGYGAGARGRLLHSSLDPQAMRCYQRAGFALEPAMTATGTVRRAALPATGPVRHAALPAADSAQGPALPAAGPVRRAAVPATGDPVGAGSLHDLDLAAAVDRAVRGAAHGPDLAVLLRAGARLLIAERGSLRGYAVVDAGQPVIVAATDPGLAATLLWAALAESGDHPVTVQVLRADQQWAIDVVHRAGLDLQPTGPLCRQGDTGPLSPYLPHTGVL